ncbi:nucleotidyltransferase family protein [uncultured Desulfobulbus sp.]|uniref:nucleotidyltransferase family protein n=1 Tax=uncultured Desulfobulbus sp. TaxID=239745 RepID=UPI0029C64EF5|nr:nucleotidyltransferase family protein [uncultured Desulfobulbus sp.]
MSDSKATNVKIPAVILAGGTVDPEMQKEYDIEYRAELPFAGKLMIIHIVDALAGASSVSTIRVVGETLCDCITETIPPNEGMLENVIAGVKACAADSPDGRVLIATSDIPFLTSEAVDDFITRCAGIDADLYYPYILKEDNDRRFPGVKRTYVKLAEGVVTGGNIVMMNADFIDKNADLLREVMNARKSISKMAKVIGIGTLLRMIVAQTIWRGALNLSQIEKAAGRAMNARLKAIRSPYPEIGADIDRLDQLEEMETLFESEGESK